MDSTLNQLYEAMTFLYGGLALGVSYTLLSAITQRVHARVCTQICDLLFALAVTLSTGLCFLIANGGVPRLFGFVLLFFGWLCARWAFQPLFRML